MRDRAKRFAQDGSKRYDLDLGIALADGCATVGNFGFEGRMDYKAVER
jgi:hypothetical protein